MTWEVRQIGPEEAACLLPLVAQVQAIHVEVQPEHYRADPDPGEVLGYLRDWLASEGVVALVAFSPDGTALGYLVFDVQVRPATPLKPAQRRGMLHHVAVDEGARRCGIGLALIEAVKVRLRAQGIARVGTVYGAFNAPSAALMRRAGLEPLNVIAEGPV